MFKSTSENMHSVQKSFNLMVPKHNSIIFSLKKILIKKTLEKCTDQMLYAQKKKYGLINEYTFACLLETLKHKRPDYRLSLSLSTFTFNNQCRSHWLREWTCIWEWMEGDVTPNSMAGASAVSEQDTYSIMVKGMHM